MNAPLSAVLLASGFTLGSILSLVNPVEVFESPYSDGALCYKDNQGTTCIPVNGAPMYRLNEDRTKS